MKVVYIPAGDQYNMIVLNSLCLTLVVKVF